MDRLLPNMVVAAFLVAGCGKDIEDQLTQCKNDLAWTKQDNERLHAENTGMIENPRSRPSILNKIEETGTLEVDVLGYDNQVVAVLECRSSDPTPAQTNEKKVEDAAAEEPGESTEQVESEASPSSAKEPSEDAPWVVICASIGQDLADAKAVAEARADKVRSAGFSDAVVLDGNDYTNIKCCYWIVVAGAFGTSDEAVELAGRIKKKNLKAYVKKAF